MNQANSISQNSDFEKVEIEYFPSKSTKEEFIKDIIIEAPILQFFKEDISHLAKFYQGIHPSLGLFEIEPATKEETSFSLSGKEVLALAEHFKHVKKSLILQIKPEKQIVSFVYDSLNCNGAITNIKDPEIKSAFSSNVSKYFLLLARDSLFYKKNSI